MNVIIRWRGMQTLKTWGSVHTGWGSIMCLVISILCTRTPSILPLLMQIQIRGGVRRRKCILEGCIEGGVYERGEGTCSHGIILMVCQFNFEKILAQDVVFPLLTC